jgi:hypothetical protein
MCEDIHIYTYRHRAVTYLVAEDLLSSLLQSLLNLPKAHGAEVGHP